MKDLSIYVGKTCLSVGKMKTLQGKIPSDGVLKAHFDLEFTKHKADPLYKVRPASVLLPPDEYRELCSEVARKAGKCPSKLYAYARVNGRTPYPIIQFEPDNQ